MFVFFTRIQERGICNLASCAVYGFWAEWEDCSATCSSVGQDSTQTRRRNCLIGKVFELSKIHLSYVEKAF